MVSTCPWTKCPPRRSPTRSDRSRLTRSPSCLLAQVGAEQGLGPGLDLEPLALGGDDRQAAAVDRHALADRQALGPAPARRRVNRLPGILSIDPLDPAQHFDQPREHASHLLRRRPAIRRLDPALIRRARRAARETLDLTMVASRAARVESASVGARCRHGPEGSARCDRPCCGILGESQSDSIDRISRSRLTLRDRGDRRT